MNSGDALRRLENDKLFKYYFGDRNPPSICTLPNLILKNAAPAVSLVLDVVGCRGGVWDEMPRFAPDGGPFISSEIKANHGYFRVWGSAPNQLWLRERGSINRLGSFVMLIDIEVPDEILDWINNNLPEHAPMLDDMQDLIVERISDLRWAYFELSDEDPLAMFVTRKEDATWVDLLEHGIRQANGFSCRVVKEGGQYTWDLPIELNRYHPTDTGGRVPPGACQRR